MGHIFFPGEGGFVGGENHLQDAPSPIPEATVPTRAAPARKPVEAVPEMHVAPDIFATVDNVTQLEQAPVTHLDLASLWRTTYAEKFASDMDSPLPGWLSDAKAPSPTPVVRQTTQRTLWAPDAISAYENLLDSAAM